MPGDKGKAAVTFADHVSSVAVSVVKSIPPGVASDVYVVSFFVYDEEDDPRFPTVTVGYNTESHLREVVQAEAGSALLPGGIVADPVEARWNYAYWLQNQLAVIGDSTRDRVGAALRQEWIIGSGWWFEYPADVNDYSQIEALAEQITTRFVDLCVQIAQQLHDQGIVQGVFGRPIPILVHELEYYEQIAQQAEHANPPGLITEFTDWIRQEE